MRRWTLLLISHDSESPKSISVTERALRIAATLGVAIALVAMIGVGSLVAQFGQIRPSRVSSAPSPEVQELRERVGALRGTLDTIRREDARLRAALGAPRSDSTTLLRRVLARLPWFLRDPRPTPRRAVAAAPVLPDSTRQVEVASGTAAVADSLLAHAEGLAEGYREIGAAGLRLDTLDVLSLRAESLFVAATAATPRVTRTGRVVEWLPARSGALLAGFNAEVVRTHEATPGVWEVELRGGGGLVGRIRAPGKPTVQPGERVVADQPVMVVTGAAGPPGTRPLASYELKRNGISLDPTFSRSSSAAGTVRVP